MTHSFPTRRSSYLELEVLKNRYMTIVMARVSTSAAEAFELGYLESSNASVSISRKWQLEQARRKAMELSDKGYVQPVAREDIRVLGRQGLGIDRKSTRLNSSH